MGRGVKLLVVPFGNQAWLAEKISEIPNSMGIQAIKELENH